MVDQRPRLGFLGIGLMGEPITLRLLEARYSVKVWNRTPKKLTKVIEQGAIQAQTPEDVAKTADIILLSLADTDVVKQIVFGKNGIAEGGSKGKILVDLSSIQPEATREFSTQLKQQCGMEWIDAPVSGGVIGAEQGTLAIMAGGKKKIFDQLGTLMESISQRFTYMGESGAGQVTKVCNQMIVSCNALVIAEVIALARKAGIDAEKIPQALAGGFADSKPLQILGPQMATDTFEPIKWHVRTLLKDLNTAVALSKSEGSEIPMSKLGAKLMREHGDSGYLEKDPATLVELYLK
ncbi:MAG: NAD(P)-dependent oxidoreductase [Gammaproteobacteria bacterium]